MKLTETQLREMTDDKSWMRGVSYYKEGRVRSLLVDQGKIIAKVIGSAPYKVELFIDGGNLEGECTCPMGDDGYFCKHCVAVGLSYLESGAPAINGKTGGKHKPKTAAVITLKEVQEYLLTKSKKELTEMFLEQVKNDDRLRDRMFLELAVRRPKGFDMTTYKDVIKKVTSAPEDGYVEYYNSSDYCGAIYEVVDSIQDLLKKRYASEVRELTEYFIERCESATGYIDDSDGCMGDICGQLEQIHLKACQLSTPEPEVLARDLFRLELQSQYDAFHGAVWTYSKLLGSKGIETYRRLVVKEWDKLPVLKPGDAEDDNSGRFRITKMMEAIAEVDQDFDMMATVHKKDLSSSWKYLKLAEFYKKYKQDNLARETAELGLKAFKNSPDIRLEEFLIEEYYVSKRQNDVMKLVWGQLERNPTLSGYQKLNKYASIYGQWDTWRSRALEFIYAYLGNKIKANRNNGNRWYRSDHSLLVEIYLWERKPKDAWDEAQAGGCSDGLWLRLAGERGKKHPGDAINLYKKRVDICVNQSNNESYEEAIKWVRQIKKLMETTKFNIYTATLHEHHKRKRNFVKLLGRV